MHNRSVRITVITRFFAVLLFFLFFFISFLQRHVYNYDFWWHLATGKYIVEHKSLPESDPFSYTSHETPTSRKLMILKGYWLAQVIFFRVYEKWDLAGITVLRAILMTLFLFFAFLTIKKQGLPDLPALLLLTGVFVLSKSYLGERPQLFTFAFFSATLYLLEDFRVSRTKKIFLIPFLLLVLSNMHPGYIVCILLITLYAAGEGIRSLMERDAGRGSLKTLLLVWFLAVAASMVNPVGSAVFAELSSLRQHTRGIVEFMPPFSSYAEKLKPVDYPYVLFLVFSAGAVRYLKKIGAAPLLVAAVFACMSFTAIRYIIFYMCASAPVIARVLVKAGEEKFLKRTEAFLDRRQGILYALTFIFGVSLVLSSVTSLARYEFSADTSFAAPKDAADFLARLEIRGNMFNEYGFGGYLIWRLYPEKKVFIDGRSLEPPVYEEYMSIAFAREDPGRSWDDIMRGFDVSYLIAPPLRPRGELYPIIEKMLDRDDWVLIYRDQLALIFLRNTPGNAPIIRQFAMDKSEAMNTIIVQASARASKNRANPYYLITLGKVFYKMGRRTDAEKAFQMAYQRDPNNPVITESLRRLHETK